MKLAVALLVFTTWSGAQTTSSASRPVVRANGDGSVSVTPDQARIHVAAVSTAPTAQEAASQNASTTANLIAQVTQALGGSGTVQTVSYTVTPNYNSQQGAPAVLTGYTVTNAIEVVLNDLTITGKIIDTATQAGATRVDGLQFTLKDDSAARGQALRAAVQKARSKAEAMAASLGMKLGAIVVVQEAGAVVIPVSFLLSTAASATPIQPGQMNVTGNVTMEVELTQ